MIKNNCFTKGYRFFILFVSCIFKFYSAHAEDISLTHEIVKPDGVILEKTYDLDGVLSSLESSDGSIAYSYSFNPEEQTLEIYDHITDSCTKKVYDSSGNLIQETLASGLTISKTYDSEGKLISLKFPDNSYVTYEYDTSYLRAIHRYNEKGEKIYTHRYTKYDSSGKLVSQELIGDLGAVDFSFDSEGKREKTSSSYLSQEIISYDLLGNISKLKHNTILREFFYDDQSRLVKETAGSNHTYGYDNCDNLIYKNGQSYNANDLNQLSDTFQYDLNGNLIVSSDGTLYAYDALNRLISAQKGDSKTLFTYDPFHRLIAKTTMKDSSQETLFFIYDGQNEIGAVDISGKIVELRILAPHSSVEAERSIAFELSDKIYAPIYDLFGNVVKLIPLSGSDDIETFDYNAFGEEAISSSKNPWRLFSKRFDQDTHLYYFGRRFYDPFLGRWLTPDPERLDGMNFYTYLHNNPYTYLDLEGLKSHKRFSFFTVDNWKLLPNPFSFVNPLPKEKPVHYELAETDDQTYEQDSHIFYVNGINNSFDEAKTNAQFISDMTSNLNVHGTYSPTQGLFTDCVNYFRRFHRKHSSPAKALKHQIKEHIHNHPSQPILIVCHSNGAVITRNALELLDDEERQKVSVVAIAPAAFIPEHLCKSVTHYESENDFVPKLDRKGRRKAKNKDNIITLKPHPKAPLFDHSLTSPTYEEPLKEEIAKHLETQEEASSENPQENTETQSQTT